MRIAIGSDKSGFSLKESIKNYLIQENISFDDLGTQSSEKGIPYFQVAEKIAREVAQGKYDRAILICGTGMGMSIVSNKHKGVYAACVESVHTAKLSRAINNANILCLGGWLIGQEKAIEMVKAFLNTQFLQGLEDWRQKYLINAEKEVNKIENRIFNE